MTLERRQGEGTRDHRIRLSKELKSRKRIKHEGEDFNAWVENYGEKGVIGAYLGWQERAGANLSGDLQGFDLADGAAMVDENEGINGFVTALQKARGKNADMRGIMRYIDQSLRHLEHDGVKVRFRGEFKAWCLNLMSETRALGPKAEELKQAS